MQTIYYNLRAQPALPGKRIGSARASGTAPLRPAERRARSSKVMIVSVLALNALIFGAQIVRALLAAGGVL